MPRKCRHQKYSTRDKAEKAAWGLQQKNQVQFVVGRCGHCGELRVYLKNPPPRKP